ncbi:glutamate carboxypeptidase [Comamonas aquatica]|nr:glutamate carboxypeptidase [Comamonas aquatica]
MPLSTAPSPPFPDATAAALQWLAEQASAMQALLQQVVDTDSGSGDVEGVQRVAALLRARLEAAGIAVQTLPEPGWGECLLARVPGHNPAATGPSAVDGAHGHGLPAWHGGATPVPCRSRPGLRPRRGRHEVRLGDERVCAGGPGALRGATRPRCSCSFPAMKKSAPRLPRTHPRNLAGCTRRAQCRTRPHQWQCRQRAQGLVPHRL